MNFEGHSINELSTDPAILADIAQLKNDVIVLARTDAFCSIEAVAAPPTLTYQPSYEIEQSVQLLSNDPALYNKGYVQSGVAGVVLEYTEIGGLSRLVNDLYYPGFVVGICWTLSEDDKKLPTARFHVTGCATFNLLDSPAEVVLKSSYSHGNPIDEYDFRLFHKPVRFGTRNPTTGDEIGIYEIDTIVERELDPLLVQVNFKVVVREQFGIIAPTFTQTITGGWKNNYRNYLQVRRLQ